MRVFVSAFLLRSTKLSLAQDFHSIMETKGMRSCSAIDRISNLPCNVIDDILKYMPLRDAVRTSILSRGWRYKWRTIPHLVFDWDFKKNLLEKHTIESVIYQVLLLHKGSITKFTCFFGIDCWASMDQWLNFLSDHHIEELKLYFSQPLSHYLFTFDHLKHLCLYRCDLRPPTGFKGFSRLAILDLNYVTTEPAELSCFISKCPMLEHFSLCNTTLPAFDIDAPNLEFFCFSTCFQVFPSICFKNTPFLEEVKIDFTKTSQLSWSNFSELFSQLPSMAKLELRFLSMRVLAIDGVSEKPTNNIRHLTVLGCYFDLANVAEVSTVVCLMRSSPNLKSVEITSLIGLKEDMKPAALFLKEQRKVKFTLSHLKYVKIQILGLKPEMEFVKLILSAATRLKKLELKLVSYSEDATNEENRILKKLARFPRASSEAKIII